MKNNLPTNRQWRAVYEKLGLERPTAPDSVLRDFRQKATIEQGAAHGLEALRAHEGMPAPHAAGAIVNAVWDIMARLANKPLWELIAEMEPRELLKFMPNLVETILEACSKSDSHSVAPAATQLFEHVL